MSVTLELYVKKETKRQGKLSQEWDEQLEIKFNKI